MDDATNEHYSMFFCEDEGLWSSFRDMREVDLGQGSLLLAAHRPRQPLLAHPGGGGEVDKSCLTLFGREMTHVQYRSNTPQERLSKILQFAPPPLGRWRRNPKTLRESGQLKCFKIEQFYLFTTG